MFQEIFDSGVTVGGVEEAYAQWIRERTHDYFQIKIEELGLYKGSDYEMWWVYLEPYEYTGMWDVEYAVPVDSVTYDPYEGISIVPTPELVNGKQLDHPDWFDWFDDDWEDNLGTEPWPLIDYLGEQVTLRKPKK